MMLKIVQLKQPLWRLGASEMLAGCFSPEASFLACRQLPSMCPHTAFLCECKSPCLCPYEDTGHVGLGSHFCNPI